MNDITGIIKQSEKLTSSLFNRPCPRVIDGKQAVSCVELQNNKAKPKPFDRMDPDKMCQECKAYWHASMCQSLLYRLG